MRDPLLNKIVEEIIADADKKNSFSSVDGIRKLIRTVEANSRMDILTGQEYEEATGQPQPAVYATLQQGMSMLCTPRSVIKIANYAPLTVRKEVLHELLEVADKYNLLKPMLFGNKSAAISTLLHYDNEVYELNSSSKYVLKYLDERGIFTKLFAAHDYRCFLDIAMVARNNRQSNYVEWLQYYLDLAKVHGGTVYHDIMDQVVNHSALLRHSDNDLYDNIKYNPDYTKLLLNSAIESGVALNDLFVATHMSQESLFDLAVYIGAYRLVTHMMNIGLSRSPSSSPSLLVYAVGKDYAPLMVTNAATQRFIRPRDLSHRVVASAFLLLSLAADLLHSPERDLIAETANRCFSAGMILYLVNDIVLRPRYGCGIIMYKSFLNEAVTVYKQYPEVFNASTALVRHMIMYQHQPLYPLFPVLQHASAIQNCGILTQPSAVTGIAAFPTDVVGNVASFLLPADITQEQFARFIDAGCFGSQSQIYESNSALTGLAFLAALAGGHDLSACDSKVRLLCDRVAAQKANITKADPEHITAKRDLSHHARRQLADNICNERYVKTVPTAAPRAASWGARIAARVKQTTGCVVS